MLIAGVLHASWHAIVKVGSGLPILAGMGLVSAAVTLPFLFFLPMPGPDVFLILALSVALHAGYKVGLARAYAHGEFSRAYPLARGFVPLFTAPIAYVGLHQLPSMGQFVGILAIVCGVCGLIIERRLVQLRLLLAAVTAGLMVAAYAVVDAWGTRAGSGWGSFTAWLIVIDSVGFLAVARWLEGPAIWSKMAWARARTLIAGVLGLASFTVFVWALSFNPVANVTAFRECSVLFSTLIGVTVLGEPLSLKKLVSVALISVGLIAIAALK